MCEKPSDLPVEGKGGWLWDERLRAEVAKEEEAVAVDETQVDIRTFAFYAYQ